MIKSLLFCILEVIKVDKEKKNIIKESFINMSQNNNNDNLKIEQLNFRTNHNNDKPKIKQLNVHH